MRVVHVDSAREWRGSQCQVLLAAQGMAARGHSVTLACQAGGRLEARARAAGLAVRPLAFGGDLAPGAILGLARLLRAESPHVVHAHDPHAIGAGLLASRLSRGPRVVASRRVSLPLRGPLSRRKYAACDRVIAVSRAVARVLLDSGLPPARLLLVRDGVPDRRPPAGGRPALEELGVPAGSPVVGNVAALTEHKDHATLLAAMPRVLQAVPAARLVIVGEGRLRGRLEAEALGRGLGDRCVFTGFRRDVDRLIPAFSLLCLTSSTEGLGSSLLDAMCFGRAVVATAVGGIPEAVADGKTGMLVPVGDPGALAAALSRLLLEADRREALGRAGRHRFEQEFTAARMVDETLRLYDELREGPAMGERPAGIPSVAGSRCLTALGGIRPAAPAGGGS
ncbi:MAG TPA: glycosyltransferase [Vicinamibacteria bacterium]|nr:glycosyltransferase [Vicinamibacteria bacterium]